jgi:pilus assembly protein Flp/PilA
MRKALTVVDQFKTVLAEFKKDEDGAALIEYTVLLGILLVAVIAIIAAVGGWINKEWTALNANLT